jgi:hypothetical protein
VSLPAHGTAPIRCGKKKCTWRGYETDLIGVPSKRFGAGVTDNVCPLCGENGYYFMNAGEIKAWERKKARSAAAAPEGA